MTAGLLPVPKARFFDNAGAPLSGGLVYTYVAGTTAPLATYNSSSGLVANSNPVVLDSAGYADIWLVGNYKIVLKDSTGVQIWSEDNIIAAGTASNYVIDTGGSNAYSVNPVPASTGYVSGQIYDIAISTANTGASTINVSGLGLKNITYANGATLVAGALPTGGVARLVYDGSEFQLQNITPPGGAASFTSITLSGSLNEAKGADIPSATSTPIGAATGNFIHVTGTTTITSFDTVQAGVRRIVDFTGILTLTYNATSLILPGGANITTAAGDCATFISEGSGNWRCVSYTKVNGMAVVSSPQLIYFAAISGFIPVSISSNTSTTVALGISVGQASDSTNTSILAFNPSSWSVTNGNAINGYQGGTTLPNSSTLHWFACSGATGTGTFASLSLTPTLPSGYNTSYRRIFSLNTDTGGGLRFNSPAVETEGGSVIIYLNVQLLDINTSTLGTSQVLSALSVPTGIRVAPLYRTNTPTSANSIILTSGDEADVAPSAYNVNGFTAAPGYDFSGMGAGGSTNAVNQIGSGLLTTNTSGQIGARASGSATTMYLVTRGFKDFRRS